jgi:hypothetical protein
MEALGRAAPSWAALKADIEAGLVRPEMDISAHVLDAMRLISSARKLAGRDGMSIGKALTELLDDVDMIEGAISPLTAALVQKFWRNGRSASADDVAAFLTRYADDARKAGAEGGMFDAPGPRDVLRAIDKDAFGNLPEDLGQPRGFARPGQNTPQVKAMDQGYDTGATSSEIEVDDAAVRDGLEASQSKVGPFGPIHRQYAGKPQEAIQRLLADKTGEAIGVFKHPDVKDPIDLVYGEAPGPDSEGSGLAKIAAKHPEVLGDLQGFLSRLKKDVARSGPNRTRLVDEFGQAVIRLDFDKTSKTWLLTAFEKERVGSAATTDIDALRAPDDTASRGTDTTQNIGDLAGPDKTVATSNDPILQRPPEDTAADAMQAEIAAARADLGDMMADMTFDLEDGTTVSFRDMLDDLDAEADLAAAVRACAIAPGGA